MKFISYIKSNPAIGALIALGTLGIGYWAYDSMWSPYAKFKKVLYAYIKTIQGDWLKGIEAKAVAAGLTTEQQLIIDSRWMWQQPDNKDEIKKKYADKSNDALWLKCLENAGLDTEKAKTLLA